MKLTQKQVQHFFLRAGFGAPLPLVEESTGLSPHEIFSSEWKKNGKVSRVSADLPSIDLSKIKDMSARQKKELQMQAKDSLIDLNTQWIKEMVSTDAQLREKMAFFWHDHFACTSNNPIFLQSYIDVIRENALENFGDLLRAISKTPAMLQYLNNQQNRKSSPNENFAREVMELFTLGRDQGYTEKDISEAARAFTGWGFNRDGVFTFRRFFHDYGEKTVLGMRGNFDGDNIIDILLKEKQTALYISQKWVRFFLDYGGNEQLEHRIADELYRSDYDIKSGLEVLFTSDEFYADEYIGRRIKSPIELMVGMQRQLHLEITNNESLIYLQRTLGQMLFKPPNVAGWNDGKDWVDSATLLFRVNLPQLVFKSGLIESELISFDDNDAFAIRGKLKQLGTELDTKTMQNNFSNLAYNELLNFILQPPFKTTQPSGDYLDQIIFLTSKPEYQLC